MRFFAHLSTILFGPDPRRDASCDPGVEAVYLDQLHQQQRGASRLFFWLFVLQWFCVLALTWSSDFWKGAAAGAVLIAISGYLVWGHPGSAVTRHFAAVVQILFSSLLVHLAGDRFEAQFHVFGSLAFLALYIDVAVLRTALIMVVADLVLRGVFWPASVHAGAPVHWWRPIEHAGWILFEVFFLVRCVRHTRKKAFELAEQAGLEQEVEEHEEAAEKMEVLNKQLIESSRQAGMAEVATGVLHNVGNVLNSVNISSIVISNRVRRSKVGELGRVAALLKENRPRLVEFLTTDSRGMLVPELVVRFADALLEEQGALIAEADSLAKNVGHIRDIVAMQQNYATRSGFQERIEVSTLVEDALRIHAVALARDNIEILRKFENTPPLLVDKHKLLQILINLVRNAHDAVVARGHSNKQVHLEIESVGSGRVRIIVRDNGVGIPWENITRIFSHGFTTKKNGHGFGLHSGALAAKEMGGSLTVLSDGPDSGASFTLELPMAEASPVAAAA